MLAIRRLAMSNETLRFANPTGIILFSDCFKRATARYPYQRQFAEDGELPELLHVPTGIGRTATAILGWLYRRRVRPESPPLRLVYCLPMRTLAQIVSLSGRLSFEGWNG